MPGLRVLATAFTGIPDIIPLHGGLPPSEAFPFAGFDLKLRDGQTVSIEDDDEVSFLGSKDSDMLESDYLALSEAHKPRSCPERCCRLSSS